VEILVNSRQKGIYLALFRVEILSCLLQSNHSTANHLVRPRHGKVGDLFVKAAMHYFVFFSKMQVLQYCASGFSTKILISFAK
jgi:hypothetical protein